MQLYELDSDPKRKEFLDDLFSFMQKRGMCKVNHPFPAQKYLHLTSYRVLYHPDLSKVFPLCTHINTQLIFHISTVMFICIYIKALQFPLFVSCWTWAVVPTFTCVIINVRVLTHVHVMIRPWNCWSMCSHIHLHKPAPLALENVLQHLLNPLLINTLMTCERILSAMFFYSTNVCATTCCLGKTLTFSQIKTHMGVSFLFIVYIFKLL